MIAAAISQLFFRLKSDLIVISPPPFWHPPPKGITTHAADPRCAQQVPGAVASEGPYASSKSETRKSGRATFQMARGGTLWHASRGRVEMWEVGSRRKARWGTLW